MTVHTRLIATFVLAGAAMTGAVLAQGAAPAPQTPAPAGRGGQAPAAGQAPADGGRGAGAGRQNIPAPAGARRGGYPQYTRTLGPQELLLRGKGLYDTNCASCHAPDLRGGPNGTNLLRSGTALSDKQGELIHKAIGLHQPTINMVMQDSVAIAEYVHSIHATMGGQGSPPGRNPTNVTLNVLVGNATDGQATFQQLCASCHSVTGDLRGIGSKHPDPRALQNAWFAGTGGGAFAGAGPGAAPEPATVTLADGTKLQGQVERNNDWMVSVRLADGTRRTIMKANDFPKVEAPDRQKAHREMVLKLDDPQNKKLHDITAYLWSIK